MYMYYAYLYLFFVVNGFFAFTKFIKYLKLISKLKKYNVILKPHPFSYPSRLDPNFKKKINSSST